MLVFEQKYGPLVDMTLLAMWQRLSLAYRLKDERTEEFAITLYKALFKRKYLYEDASAED